MGVTTINIRLNDEDKKIFNEICNELGLNMSTAFNMFVKSMIRTGGLPFEVKINNFNAETHSGRKVQPWRRANQPTTAA